MATKPDTTPVTGKIYLCKGVPLSNSYAHSIYFESLSNQLEYFTGKANGELDTDDSLPSGKVVKVLTKQNYVKKDSGVIRIEVQEESQEDVNYMIWKTPVIGATPPGDNYTWFFAFITEIVYVSNAVTELHYELDVLQTYAVQSAWNGAVDFKQTYIERRHYKGSRTNPTVNLEPENIPIVQKKISKGGVGESDNFLLQSTEYDTSEDGDLDTLLVFTSKFIDPNHTYASDADTARAWNGNKHGNLRQGLFVEVIKPTEADDFFAEVYGNTQDYADAIVAIVCVPNFMANHRDNNNPLYLDDNKYKYSHAINLAWNRDMDGVSVEDIKNKKLFTAPYNTLILTDGVNQQELEFEYIGNYQTTMANFVELYYTAILSITPDAKIQFIMDNYNKTGTLDHNLLSSCIMSDLQRIPWSTSAYSEWLANNGISAGVNALTSAGTGAAGGFAVGGVAGAGIGALAGLGSSLLGSASGLGTSLVQSPITKGRASSNNLIALGKYNVFAYRSCLSREDVERIDDYFTMFGYACNRIGRPFKYDNGIDKGLIKGVLEELNECYIKTRGCLCSGGCNAEYLRKIEQIFNSGITWWNKNHIGEYN